MKAQIVDNSSRTMATVLSTAIQRSQDVRIAVAFASQKGLSLIWESLEQAISSGAYVEFIVGLDSHVTEPSVLKNLYSLDRSNAQFSFFCYSREKEPGIYHPKLYLARVGDEVTSIIGSSNLTEGGLRTNIEINVAISGNVRDEVISDSYTAYNLLKFDDKKFELDEEYMSIYEEARKRERIKTPQDSVLKELLAQLDEKAKTLRHPKPTRRDVVGWLELVYDALPAGEFTNSQAYLSERMFQDQYPNNQHIRAKIRQQLQLLRSMGMVRQVSPAHWVKL